MKEDLTAEELLAVYGGSYEYVDHIDGTPLQGQAIIAAESGKYNLVLAQYPDGLVRAVAVTINGKDYDLPGDNPNHPGPY